MDTTRRIRIARLLAIAADVLQVGLFPLFGEGALSPANDALELGVAAAMVWLLGWHWAFLPGMLAESIPGLNLFPTWTAAVFFVTRGGATAPPESQGRQPSSRASTPRAIRSA